MLSGRWKRHSAVWIVGAALTAATLSGCVGAVDRADFEQEMRERGGGMTTSLIDDGFRQLTGHYQVNSLAVTSIDISPDTTMGVTVRAPHKPDQLDRFTFDGARLGDPSPVMVSVIDDLDARSFTLDEVPALRNVEMLVDDALERSKLEDGEVTGISVSRTESIHAAVMVESPRSRVLVVFDPSGIPTMVQPL